MRITASVGYTIVASGTFSIRTSPARYMTVARIDIYPVSDGLRLQAGEEISVVTRSFNRCAVRSLRSEFAVPVGGGHAAIHEEVAAGDEPAVRAHEQRADGCPPRPECRRAQPRTPRSCAGSPAPRGPVSSSLASGVMMMPGLIVLTRAPRLPQRTASAITRSEFPRFASW